jgi:CRP-like cAMP-binding protein
MKRFDRQFLLFDTGFFVLKDKIMPSLLQLKKQETLFVESDVSSSIFIVKKGVLSIRKKNYGHQDAAHPSLELAKISTGEVLGELSFFDRQPRSATAIALIETEVLEIPFDELDQVYQQIPAYMRKIIESLATRLREANTQIRNLTALQEP